MRYILIILFALSGFNVEAQYSDSITVNLFLLDECMISINMTQEINRMYTEYNNENIHFVAYFPNKSSKPKKIKAFADKYQLEMPVKTDYFKRKAQKLGATVAPEVVVFDERNQVVLYRGRINNSYAKIGSRRRVTNKNDLEDAILSIRDNKEIAEKETQAIGCFINFSELNQ